MIILPFLPIPFRLRSMIELRAIVDFLPICQLISVIVLIDKTNEKKIPNNSRSTPKKIHKK